MIPRSLLASAALCCALPAAAALLIRADRDDAEYLELGTHYPSSVPLSAPGGEGVLIAPRWILTSARAASALRPGTRLAIGNRAAEIQAIHVHPESRGATGPDIALLLLREPVEDVEPAAPYRAADEAGKGVVIVAHGLGGRIGEKPQASGGDARARAAINTVDRVAPATLALRIKPPDDASDLQGVPAPGTHGAPAFIEAGGRHFVAGLHSTIEDASGDGTPGNAGDWDVYTRVSAFAEWIDVTMFRAATEEAARATAKPR